MCKLACARGHDSFHHLPLCPPLKSIIFYLYLYLYFISYFISNSPLLPPTSDLWEKLTLPLADPSLSLPIANDPQNSLALWFSVLHHALALFFRIASGGFQREKNSRPPASATDRRASKQYSRTSFHASLPSSIKVQGSVLPGGVNLLLFIRYSFFPPFPPFHLHTFAHSSFAYQSLRAPLLADLPSPGNLRQARKRGRSYFHETTIQVLGSLVNTLPRQIKRVLHRRIGAWGASTRLYSNLS
ncbi:hypothetical protein B0I35DRAFT_124566 [Stachybotrys elegans]|uniref:Uncharacterized protein n=1 Tax=Stachybotrys elegans TaxID=80388 RepID=A0A8K0SYE9_9HYPO|nr:hypothetical protein B0I35DRAFT_124566 [Stachybotrys elegans]